MFCTNLGVTFNDYRLLEMALTHTSYANESGSPDNERLEFLGDSVLGLVCADYLYGLLDGHQEGDLSRIKAMVVSEESLAEVALRLELPRYIHIGHGEEINGGREFYAGNDCRNNFNIVIVHRLNKRLELWTTEPMVRQAAATRSRQSRMLPASRWSRLAWCVRETEKKTGPSRGGNNGMGQRFVTTRLVCSQSCAGSDTFHRLKERVHVYASVLINLWPD